jgi:hypothetical protein
LRELEEMPAAAALTPRVRIMVVCDEVIPSDIENDVFTLEGVRQHVVAELLPCLFEPTLYLCLSCSRRGKYRGETLIIHDRSDRTIRQVKFTATFRHDNEMLPITIAMGECRFPEPGEYTLQVSFVSQRGEWVLKAEQPFEVLSRED